MRSTLWAPRSIYLVHSWKPQASLFSPLLCFCFFALVAGTHAGAETVAIANAGFESPILGAGNFQYGVTIAQQGGSGWDMLTGGGGAIAANGSNFLNPFTTPFGNQVGVIQQAGQFAQALSFDGGSYELTFYAAGRRVDAIQNLEGSAPFEVSIDGNLLSFGPGGTMVDPAIGVFSSYTSDPFTLSGGTHTLSFAGTENLSQGGDRSSFIDEVSISSVAAPLPSPLWGGLLLLACAALPLLRKRPAGIA